MSIVDRRCFQEMIMINSEYRRLTDGERQVLERQNCRAEDWNSVEVAGDFDPCGIRNCTFSGTVRIGNAVRLEGVGLIANCEIGEGAEIRHTTLIECCGESSFGCGTQVAVINENGGRSVPLFPTLTAQLAYITSIYRHRTQTIEHLNSIFAKGYTTGTLCRIGRGTRIIGCGILRNVQIGDEAVLEGVSRLENGTVASASGQTTYIGAGVKLRDFVICGNSRVDNGTVGERCFFGNGSHVASANCVDSMFFAGSDCENGEFCSVLAGPYTASHHKATLLIAGMFSFFNAGSGTNFSNHLLKSGPVHQGIHQRGCKYGSGSYMMLPALDGAYTTVIGHHRNHPNTELFPFSLVIEREGQTWLIPGANLAACGNRRDLRKWPQRDRRDLHSADIINFDECNPYIAERIEHGLDTIVRLSTDAGDTVIHKGMRIRSAMLRRGAKLYGLALQKYTGGILACGAEPDAAGEGRWTDALGMYLPVGVMENILNKIDAGELNSTAAITRAMSEVHNHYENYAAGWAYGRLRRELGHAPSASDIATAIEQGQAAAARLDALADEDLRAESDAALSVGYGLDALDEATIAADYKSVRNI